MLRSLFAGVSGLRSHQEMMDVVGNNIANVNTTGFKSSNVVFQDLLSQVVSGAGAPSVTNAGTTGGTNPAQVGLGARVASITTNFTQGALQTTGRATDLAIQGDGFFVTSLGGQQLYTRAGSFNFDANGNMITPEGGLVQGWMADPATHVLNPAGPTTNLTMAPGQILSPVKTGNIQIGNMLSANAPIGTAVPTGITAYDTQGNSVDLKFTLTKTATNAWSVTSADTAGNSLGGCALTFDPATGNLKTQAPASYTIQPVPAANWPAPIKVSFGASVTDPTALKEFGGTSTASAIQQDGSAAGTLQSFTISNDGVVTGVFSNGKNQAVGQVAMASFNNPSGLEKAGGSSYQVTANSGVPQIGLAGSGGRGSLAAGSLEMSNVDLSQEFTNLIIAQRGFQANAKVITTSDQLLQSLLELKQ